MTKKIDIKSAAIGFLFGGFAVIATTIGVTSTAAAPPRGETVTADQVGRYQVSGTGNQGLVIDTVTGKVWTAFFSATGGNRSPDFYDAKNTVKK